MRSRAEPSDAAAKFVRDSTWSGIGPVRGYSRVSKGLVSGLVYPPGATYPRRRGGDYKET